ncbi:MAG: hypothetical protein AAGH41_04460 [Pseudomonadota bacterium]
MTRDDENAPVPVPTSGEGSEIVARSAGEVERMSDEELLGHDYQAWLDKRKVAARTTVTKGIDARLRADDVMAEAEDLLARAEARLGKK